MNDVCDDIHAAAAFAADYLAQEEINLGCGQRLWDS